MVLTVKVYRNYNRSYQEIRRFVFYKGSSFDSLVKKIEEVFSIRSGIIHTLQWKGKFNLVCVEIENLA